MLTWNVRWREALWQIAANMERWAKRSEPGLVVERQISGIEFIAHPFRRRWTASPSGETEFVLVSVADLIPIRPGY
jgi:hypothetical protein